MTYLLERIQEYGFHLRFEKCNFFTELINYLGYIIDGKELCPDPKKVAAIIDMPLLKNLTTLREQSIIMSFYFKHAYFAPLIGPFVEKFNLAMVSAISEIVSFEQFKKILISDLLLTHYNPKYEIIVAADVSIEGLEACILHRFPDHSIKAICHAARSLTSAEHNYSQIEKEGLALCLQLLNFTA